MPRSPEFDFSKLNDQQIFEDLPKKKRKEFIEESMKEATKVNEELSRKESREKEEKPFFFVYRENDLFKKYVPFIQNLLEEKGFMVNLQSFPAGTPEEKIKNWYLAHQAELQSKNILADNTSKNSCGYDEKGSRNLKSKINLDQLMNQAAVEAITGDTTLAKRLENKIYNNLNNPEKLHEAKQEYLSALGKIYKNILISMPKEQRQKMEVVILKGLFKGNYVFPPLIAHEPYAPDRKNFEELQKETNDFADRMKEWFSEAGISNTTVFSTGAEIPAKTIKKLTEGSANIIFDRHTTTSSSGITREGVEDMRTFWGSNTMYAEAVKRCAALQTPVETFYQDAVKKLSIQADPEKMEEIIKRRFQEELDATEEVKTPKL